MTDQEMLAARKRKFLKHLDKCAMIVAKWPRWKRRAMSAIDTAKKNPNHKRNNQWHVVK